MEERSKTNKEIYEQKYPIEKLAKSTMLCAEAVGYLKALKEYCPSEQKWAENEIELLVLVVLLHSL